MKTYLVGGAVRDRLLGLESNDHDYVVVGATPADMLALGYTQVGESFPVFLAPNGDEYALARVERKTGPGYLGFETKFDASVSLEDDLARRDLTINAMAMDMETGELVDPYGGEEDLKMGVLRHVSSAFEEDPLRVVRLARFLGRFNSFTIADETFELARAMVDAGQLDELADERFVAEMDKAFDQSENPMTFVAALDHMGALQKVRFFADMLGSQLPVVWQSRFAQAVKREELPSNMTQAQVFCALVASIKGAAQTSNAIPSSVKTLTRNLRQAHATSADAESILQLLTRVRAFNPDSAALEDLLRAMRIQQAACVFFRCSHQKLQQAAAAVRTVCPNDYLHLSGPQIGAALAAARLEKIKLSLKGNEQ